MLVLTRKLNESIRIGDQIEVVVLKVSGDRVRLGIRAPREIPVHRFEVVKQIRDENSKPTENPEKHDTADVAQRTARVPREHGGEGNETEVRRCLPIF